MQDKWKRQRKWKRKFKVLPPDDSTERGNATAKGAGTLPLKFTPTFIHDADQRYGNIQETKRRLERFKQDTGADNVQRETLCLIASFLSVLIETRAVEALEGGKLDAGSLTQTINSYVGVLRALGMSKAKADRSLKEYLASKGRTA